MELDPDEREALRARKIITRLRRQRSRKCLAAAEWEMLLHLVPDPVRMLALRVAVHHGFVEEETVCKECGRVRTQRRFS